MVDIICLANNNMNQNIVDIIFAMAETSRPCCSWISLIVLQVSSFSGRDQMEVSGDRYIFAPNTFTNKYLDFHFGAETSTISESNLPPSVSAQLPSIEIVAEQIHLYRQISPSLQATFLKSEFNPTPRISTTILSQMTHRPFTPCTIQKAKEIHCSLIEVTSTA